MGGGGSSSIKINQHPDSGGGVPVEETARFQNYDSWGYDKMGFLSVLCKENI